MTFDYELVIDAVDAKLEDLYKQKQYIEGNIRKAENSLYNNRNSLKDIDNKIEQMESAEAWVRSNV